MSRGAGITFPTPTFTDPGGGGGTPPPLPGTWDPTSLKVGTLAHAVGVNKNGANGDRAYLDMFAARTGLPTNVIGCYEGFAPFKTTGPEFPLLTARLADPNVVVVWATHMWTGGQHLRYSVGNPKYKDPAVDITAIEAVAGGAWTTRCIALGQAMDGAFTLNQIKRIRWRGLGVGHEHNGSFMREGPPRQFWLPQNTALTNRFIAAVPEAMNRIVADTRTGLGPIKGPWLRTDLNHFGEGVDTAAEQDYCAAVIAGLDPGIMTICGLDKYSKHDQNNDSVNGAARWSTSFGIVRGWARAAGVPVALDECDLGVGWNLTTDYDSDGAAFFNQIKTDLTTEMTHPASGLAYMMLFELDQGPPSTPGGTGTGEKKSYACVMPPKQRFPGVTAVGGRDRLTLTATTNGVTYASNWPLTAAAVASFAA